MFVIAFLVLSAVAAASAALLRLAGVGVAVRDMVVASVAILVAVETSLLAIRLLKGQDQASAAQAGISGMVLLMVLSVGISGACLILDVFSGDAAVRCLPSLFVAALVLVASDAIRTIRSRSAGKYGATKERPDKVK